MPPPTVNAKPTTNSDMTNGRGMESISAGTRLERKYTAKRMMVLRVFP